MKILFVDDNELMVALYSELLEMGGHTVSRFYSAEKALQWLQDPEQKANIDVIISDVKMPNMDGLSFYKAIHALEKNIPFIFLTGDTEFQEVPSDAIVLEKPLSSKKLMATIAQLNLGRSENPSDSEGEDPVL